MAEPLTERGRVHAVRSVNDLERTLCGRHPDLWAPGGLVILGEGDDPAAVDCLACGQSLVALGDHDQTGEPDA